MSIDQIAKRINYFIEVINIWVMVFATILIFASVILRYAFGISYEWIEELCRYVLLYVAFLAAAAMMYMGGHVALDILVKMYFSEKALKVHGIFVALLSALISIFLTYYGYKQLAVSFGITTMSLAFPLWFPTSVIPVTMIVASFFSILKLITLIKERND